MFRKLIFLTSCLLLVGLASASTVWNPAANGIVPPDTGDWNDAANWTNGLPDNPDTNKAVFNVPDAAECIVSGAQTANQWVQGDGVDGGVVRVISGGSLSQTQSKWSAVGYNAPAHMIVEAGGLVEFGQHMWIGLNDGSVGTLDINGGVVTVAQMLGLGWNGGTATGYVNVNDGGLLALSNIHGDGTSSIKGASLLSINGTGAITLPGDFVGVIDAYAAAGLIAGDGVLGAVQAVVADDVTTVTAMLAAEPEADTLSGLADVTVVDDAIVSVQHEGTEYVVADGDLILGTTTRWYIDTGVETLWAEGDPAPAETVSGTSSAKDGDVGSKADNFLFRLDGSTNISSIDGIDFQETIFPSLTDTFFLFERGGNDTGTWQAIHADGSLGAAVAFDKASAGGPYSNTGINVGGQDAHGVVFKTSVPVQGVRITASGHDTLSISTPKSGVTIIVDPNGDIAAANESAQAGDTIEIAEGTYNLMSQIEIKDGVTYKGAGAGLTIIDGSNVTRAFVAWGDRGATNGQVDENGVGVLNATGPTGWVLDGLTIQNCVSDTDNRQDILSAARDLLNNYTGTPYTLATAQEENGGVTDNPGWFDILSGSADDDLTDVELQAYLDANPVGSAGHLVVNDDKSNDGGAVLILNGAAGTIRNCTFSTNAADDDGGAVMVDGVGLDVAIDNCAFDLNTCGDEGGAIKLSGNASIYTITDTAFAGCSAGDDGGAIRADGDDSSYVLTDCTLIGNYASDDGAAVRYGTDRAELTVTNCAFIGNGKDADGTVVGDDGVWSTHDDDAGPMTFINCLFADNACNDDRLIEIKAAFAFLNCTFIGNVAGDKPLIAVRGRPWDSTGDGEDDVTTDDSIINNCLFINNTMLSDSRVIGDTRNDVFVPTVTNCLFFGNLDGSNPASNTDDNSPEVGTIDVSAVTDAAQLVVDPAGDYHLAAGSAAIDASDPATATATDIEGTPAVGVRDVGAYEFVAP